MSYPINYPTPQGANIQTFYKTEDWVKPQGASFVWFTLIGAGGAGGRGISATGDGYGGGSGAVTNFMGPAFLMPDTLQVIVGAGGKPTTNNGGAGVSTIIRYQVKDGIGYSLLVATGGGGGNDGGGSLPGAGGAASTSNYFSAMGFFQSVAGQDGAGIPTASTTTFLGGGAQGPYRPTANYGYTLGPANANGQGGYFQMQPIIVGIGSNGSATASATNYAGTGCGGGGGTSTGNLYGGVGGDGLAVIITW